MPLTVFQEKLARILAVNRTPESHLAGGAAIHLGPNSIRFSNDLDYFNDSLEKVAEAFSADFMLLIKNSFEVKVEIQQPGYIRARIVMGAEATKVEWAMDSSWRFMPAVKDEICGYRLHGIDLATNKILALAGRNEPRDFIDILDLNKKYLSFGALVWAAVAKDPGFNPRSLLELLKRRGKFRPEDFLRLHLNVKLNQEEMKKEYVASLEAAEKFIEERDPEEVGCLYFSPKTKEFFAPDLSHKLNKDYELHFGRPGGILPAVLNELRL